MNKILVILFAFLCFACNSKTETTPAEVELESPVEEKEVIQPKEYIYSTQTYDSWLNYYDNTNDSFNASNFKKDESYTLVKQETTSLPAWDKDYKPVHKDLLVYNSDSSLYIDFNSYQVQFDDKNNLIISPDQEIILGDPQKKEINRILFYGPSFWVEDAYFKNDSVVVLIENSTDQIPGYQEINLNTLEANYYLYDKKLDNESDYRRKKIKRLFKDNM